MDTKTERNLAVGDGPLDLERGYRELAKEMRAAADRLDAGLLPDADLEPRVASLRARYREARERLSAPPADDSLDALGRAIEAKRAVDEVVQERERLAAALRPLGTIEHVSGELEQQLSSVRASIAALLEELDRVRTIDDLHAMEKRTAPWAALSRLVIEGTSLSESDVFELGEEAAELVPRIVANAAGRGTLRLGETERDSEAGAAAIVSGSAPGVAVDADATEMDDRERRQTSRRGADGTRPFEERVVLSGGVGREVSDLLRRYPLAEDAEPLRRLANLGRDSEGRVSDLLARRDTSPTASPGDDGAAALDPDGGRPPFERGGRAGTPAASSAEPSSTDADRRDEDSAGIREEAPMRPQPAVSIATPEVEVTLEIASGETEIPDAAEAPAERSSEGSPATATSFPTAVVAVDEVWTLLGSSRLSLAYHLVRARETLNEARVPLPSWLVLSLLLGPEVRKPLTGDIAPRLAEVFAEHGADELPDDEETGRLQALLAAAATLVPALLAPNTGVISVLQNARHRLSGDLPELAAVLAVVGEFSQRGHPIDVRRLRAVGDIASWRESREDLIVEASEWLDRAIQYNIGYAPATSVWQRWLKEDGELGGVVRAIVDNGTLDPAEAREWLVAFQGPADFGDLVDATFRDVLGRRWKGQEIYGGAKRSLERKAREAVDLVERWASLHEVRPDRPRSFEAREADRLRQALGSLLPSAQKAVASSEDGGVDAPGSIALGFVKRSLDLVDGLFRSDEPFDAAEPAPDELVNDEVALCDFAVDATGGPSPETPPERVVASIRELVVETPTWQDAFERRLERNDTLGADVVLAKLRRSGGDEVERLQARFDAQVTGLRLRLEAKVRAIREGIDVAMALGLLSEAERATLVAEVEEVEASLKDDPPRYDVDDAKLRGVEESLATFRAERRKQLEARLAEQGIGPESDTYERVTKALEEDDFVTATEHLYAELEGRHMSTAVQRRDPFREFFVDRFETISGVTRRSWQKLPKAVRKQSVPESAIDMSNVPKLQAEQAAELLDAWFSARREKNTNLKPRLQTILEHVGFDVSSIERWTPGAGPGAASRGAWYTAQVAPIADRNMCPIPQFGSFARGRYRLLCIWDRQGEEDLVNAIGETRHGPPVLVLHFGTLTETRRRNIARLARERKQSTFIVLDDASMLFLCGERGARMPIMFETLLPFAAAEPYTTTAGQVPPEMFYGRDHERHDLREPHGSSFVYGGRQLGKTALLRAVEREAHDPDEGRVAVWMDLKSENIGVSRKASDLWHLVTRELKKHHVVPDKIPTSASPQKIGEHVEEFLASDPERRILLLLDEADKFLESDAADAYEVTGALKGIMDKTDRRFKVVLAGLHNVQRMTTQVNQPLAHYGDPICVGPLLHNGEVVAARELIRRPMAALGYRFESEDLITRILGQTNYYPSLIQLYCSHLLRHLTGIAFGGKKTPPYVVTSEHLDAVYRSGELHKAIRQRFQLTLQLDQRYEVLAYVIAYLCLDEARGLVDGFSVQRIRDEAMGWWADGFRGDDALHAFAVLLDEMVGLGILRSTDDQRYTLRNRNVMDLMGGREEIESNLLVDREPPPEYEPDTFRNQIMVGKTIWLAPLTARQESELLPKDHGVDVVLGTEAADVSRLGTSLNGPGRFVHVIDGVDDARAFARELRTIGERQRGSTTVVLVDTACPWTDEWTKIAQEKVKGLRSRDSYVRIVFAGGPDLVRGLVADESPLLGARPTAIALGPWHDAAVRTWLGADGYPTLTPGDRAEIREVTGNWPSLLRRLADGARDDQGHWREHLQELDRHLRSPEVAREVLREFGLDRHESVHLAFVLQEVGPATAEGLADLGETSLPLDLIRAELAVGERLQLVRAVGRGKFRVDPVIGRLAQVVVA